MAAFVRCIHVCPDAPAVDIKIDGNLVINNLHYNQDTDYMEIGSGKHSVKIIPTGKDNPTWGPMDFNIEDHRAYTALLMGLLNGKPGFEVKLILDRIPAHVM